MIVLGICSGRNTKSVTRGFPRSTRVGAFVYLAYKWLAGFSTSPRCWSLSAAYRNMKEVTHGSWKSVRSDHR